MKMKKTVTALVVGSGVMFSGVALAKAESSAPPAISTTDVQLYNYMLESNSNELITLKSTNGKELSATTPAKSAQATESDSNQLVKDGNTVLKLGYNGHSIAIPMSQFTTKGTHNTLYISVYNKKSAWKCTNGQQCKQFGYDGVVYSVSFDSW